MLDEKGRGTEAEVCIHRIHTLQPDNFILENVAENAAHYFANVQWGGSLSSTNFVNENDEIIIKNKDLPVFETHPITIWELKAILKNVKEIKPLAPTTFPWKSSWK